MHVIRLTTITCCLFCLQVQIYELEEHKIETWRGLYNTNIYSYSARSADEEHKDSISAISVSLLAEIYLHSINRLISITPDCR